MRDNTALVAFEVVIAVVTYVFWDIKQYTFPHNLSHTQLSAN
jgi:hypothetical protein